jgi:hypothetical protein
VDALEPASCLKGGRNLDTLRGDFVNFGADEINQETWFDFAAFTNTGWKIADYEAL